MEENQLPECCCSKVSFKEIEQKDLRTRIQEKLNERIENILNKSELTDDDFRILESRLLMIRTEETLFSSNVGFRSRLIEEKEA